MNIEYNDQKLKLRRRQLRSKQTEAELKLWHQLRNKQMKELKFCRQYSVGSFILDFYCPKKRLAIELDGSQHLEPKMTQHDKQRTAYLESKKIKVIRFWNDEVFQNMDGVLEKIWEELS